MRTRDENSGKELILLGMSGYSSAAISRQLGLLFQSEPFLKQGLARKLLQFLVSEALVGRVPGVKDVAAALGKQAFDEGDSYVRTAKTRLLMYLEEYYSSYARPHEIRFVINEYIVFTKRNPLPALELEDPPLAYIYEPGEGEIAFAAETEMNGMVTGLLSPDLSVWSLLLYPDESFYPIAKIHRTVGKNGRIVGTTHGEEATGNTRFVHNFTIFDDYDGEREGLKISLLVVAIDKEYDSKFKRMRYRYQRPLPPYTKVLARTEVVLKPTTDYHID